MRPLPMLALGLAAAAIACGDAATGPSPPGPPAVDLETLFRAPSAAEIAAVEAEWGSRSPVAEAVVEEASLPLELGAARADVRVFSHRVDGFRHYGAVVVPAVEAGRRLPVAVFAHPGDGGVGAPDLALAVGLMGEAATDFVYVVPTFRSESLSLGPVRFTSEGRASPWDRDVDDALALLDVAVREVPEADPERVAAVGVSRGGGVALLMAARDPRIDLVVEISGPTDFFGPYVRDLVAEALGGAPASLPGFATLHERFVVPLAAGTLSEETFRAELIRRSPVLFAHRLPPVQIHHGTADAVVSVGQAYSLAAALEAAEGRTAPDELHLYAGVGHDPIGMAGARERVVAYLSRLLGPP